MKYIFIMNQNAGKAKCEKILPNIERECKKKNIEYEIRYITKEKSGSDIAKEYKNEENVIYVAGGDGTITMTIGGIVGTKNKLGIIPSGSGNDTYRAIKKLPKGENTIDLAKINDTYFINVACSGLDAEVANNVDIVKKARIPSNQIYNASIIYTFIKFKFKEVELITNVKKIKEKYTILSICNGSYYGGGFNIAPKSELTDGLLDIYFVEKMNKLRMIPLLLKVKKGKHEGKRKIHKFRTNHVEINLDKEVTFNVDGEKVTDKNFIIDLIPKAIKVYNDDEFVQNIMI
ncbi:MAG: diacylglycerol kinase family lipid kinase [Clostridia bacterium]|nr:diacylglycerol kinase family lipid kinase [Clostridia bacterium]